MSVVKKLQDFAASYDERLYVHRATAIEDDWRLQNWVLPCYVCFPSSEVQSVTEVSGVCERRQVQLMRLHKCGYTFQTDDADAECEVARLQLLEFVKCLADVFHVEQLSQRQIWDGANGDLIVGWSVSMWLRERVGLSACGDAPEPREIEITENGTYNVLPFGRAIVDVQGGTPAVVEPLEVTPDTEAHTYNPPAGVDGFAPVTVGACPVCPAPDVRPLSVVPSRDSQNFSPVGFDGFAPVEVQGYTPNLQAKTAEPATTAQVVTADEGYDGLSSVTVDAVTADIDANIQPGNIKKDVEILGVVGTMEPKDTSGDEFVLTYNGTDYTLLSDSNIITTIVNGSFGWAKSVWLKEATNIERAVISGNNNIFRAPKASNIARAQAGTNTEYIELGNLTNVASLAFTSNVGFGKLRNFIIAGCNVSLVLSGWTATNVIAEGQSGIDELNYNIKTYLADKVADRTNDTALTVTFGAALYNVLTAATIAAFTAKNWNVASA